MSEHWSQLKSYLGLSAIVSLYGIASLLVLLLGPTFGIGLTYQIVIIALILLTWPFAVLINHFRKKRAERREAASGGQPAQSDGSGGQVRTVNAAGYDELTRSAEEAVQWLRSTKLGAAGSDDVLYGLPWFVIAGPPGSGKTSLLLSAGLDFHALPSQRRADQNIVRPTRACEWRVTDSAVLLDTAGRYQTEGPDTNEWAALIQTIRRYRKTRPLDGLVIAVNAADVLASSESEIEQQAKVLRARLDQVIAGALARFPVYLVFSRMDTIEGFGDFFRPFDSRERAQVWGATIPLEQSANAHALFDVEFDYLYDALMRRRLLRLSEPAASDEQLRVFDFPLHFAAARSKLGLFTSALFRPNPFSESPLLRGFYFASNLTDGRPARVGAGVDDSVGEFRIEGQGCFTEDLIKDVLLRDKDLAASFQAVQKHPHRVRNVLLGVAAAFLAVLSIGMVVSFIGNYLLIAEGEERGQRVFEIAQSDAGNDPAKKDSAAARTELEAVDQLRDTVARLDDYDQNAPPPRLRFGLYSGNSISTRLREIYFDSINQRFFKSTAAALEQDLRDFTAGTAQVSKDAVSVSGTTSSDDLGRYYDLLKAYLMISLESDRAEPSFLMSQLADYWKRRAPRDLENLAKQQLEFYARQASSGNAPHWPKDDKLIAEARRKLEAYPAIDRFYKSITTDINAKVPPITLDTIVQGQGRGWLSGSPSVPGAFTLLGYQEHMLDAFESAAGEISKDDWVMGSTAKGQTGDIGKLRDRYFRDYITHWQKFLKDTSVTRFNSKDDAVAALRVMSGSNSPLLLVINKVASETNLSGAKSGGGFFGWLKGLFGGSKSETGTGGTLVEKEFNPLFQFVSAEGDKGDSSGTQYRNALRGLHDQLEIASNDQFAQVSKALLTNRDDIGLLKAEQAVSRLLESFNTPASTDAAALMKQPLRNIRGLVSTGAFEQIDQIWRNQIYPKAHQLETGFPFTDSGEASVDDLARFLNPADGELTVFFKDRLASSFDDVQDRWKLKESGAFQFSEEFVNYLNNARQLRDALFPPGAKQPAFTYDVTLQQSEGADVLMEIDSNPPVSARSGAPASATLKWPTQGGESGARISVIQGGTAPPPPRTFTGKWGLFRMFQAGGPNKTGDNQYQLGWSSGAVRVRATLRPPSAKNNPFQLSLFRQLRAPQNLR